MELSVNEYFYGIKAKSSLICGPFEGRADVLYTPFLNNLISISLRENLMLYIYKKKRLRSPPTFHLQPLRQVVITWVRTNPAWIGERDCQNISLFPFLYKRSYGRMRAKQYSIVILKLTTIEIFIGTQLIFCYTSAHRMLSSNSPNK